MAALFACRGSNAALALLDQGVKLVVLDDLSLGNRSQVPDAAALLGWRPRFVDLEKIVGHALAWEKKRLTAT